MNYTLKVKKSAEKEVTIDLPCCWVNQVSANITEYLAVLDEKTAIAIFRHPTYTGIRHTEPDTIKNEIAAAVNNNWEWIPDGDFLEVYDNVLASLNLHPQLISI